LQELETHYAKGEINLFYGDESPVCTEGFCTSEPIDAKKEVDFLDRFSFGINPKTFVVLDNASVHRNAKIRQMRSVWEKRGLFLFHIPPYFPHLIIVETLWRIMKGKWIRPQNYICADALFYATNRALAAIGRDLKINYEHNAA
jgi:transposase